MYYTECAIEFIIVLILLPHVQVRITLDAGKPQS